MPLFVAEDICCLCIPFCRLRFFKVGFMGNYLLLFFSPGRSAACFLCRLLDSTISSADFLFFLLCNFNLFKEKSC